MLKRTLLRGATASLVAGLIIALASPGVAAAQNVFQATRGETDAKTGEVSPEELRRILADGSAIVLDSRKRAEHVAGHIAGAQNVAPPEGAPPAADIEAITKPVNGDRRTALQLHYN